MAKARAAAKASGNKPGRKPNKLTPKQKAFADDILKGKTQRQAALDNYDIGSMHGTNNPERVADHLAIEALKKPQVLAYLHTKAEQAERHIARLADLGVERAEADNKSTGAAWAGVALTAARDVLDRVHGKPTQRIEAEVKSLTISIDMSNAD